MLLAAALCAATLLNSEPPNQAGTITYKGNKLSLAYDGQTIFRAELALAGKPYIRKMVQQGSRGEIDQVFAITADSIELKGAIVSDGDSFACAAEPTGYSQPQIVRHSLGKTSNSLNRAVYERTKDWLISFDEEANVSIAPKGKDGYGLTASGSEIIVRFRPRYYSKHRGLTYFQPWKRKAWDKSEVGWSSWFAFWDKVTQSDIHKATDVLAEKLKPYGLTTVQIDDGYQQAPVGLPNTWINANEKFPDGMANLAKYIKGKGLVPGIWNAPMVHREEDVKAHKDLFIRDKTGNPVHARWIGYPIDGSNPKAIDTFVRPVFKEYAKNGWEYFKMDSLRHLRYEGYNSQADYFEAKRYDRTVAFRNVVQAARDEIGTDKFLMACWGVHPELAGIVDAQRIGGDGFGYECMAQYNSFNNVVWRNDPDHIQATHDDGFRDCTITSLTGSLYMLTDTPDELATKDLSAVKATIPVLFTKPGQVYDVDASRSVHLDEVDSQVSGSGPRPFDASRSTTTGLFQLDVAKEGKQWTVLARVNDQVKSVAFSDLGLKAKQKYVVFEFWTKKLIGVFSGAFDPGAIDPKYRVQLFCIRPLEDHPFVIASDRHISCGALEMTNLKYEKGVLSGTSDRVPGQPYTVYIYVPNGYRPTEGETAGNFQTVSFPARAGEPMRWTTAYSN